MKITGFQELGRRGKGSDSQWYVISLGVDKNVLNLDCGDDYSVNKLKVYKLCKQTKSHWIVHLKWVTLWYVNYSVNYS